ncbi:MAG: PDZ domain-containing protein [Candidatus Brocadiales bacterium]
MVDRMKTIIAMLMVATICAGCATGDESAGVRSMQKTIRQNGILINEIAENSAAQKAGLRSGDVIVSYEGTMIRDPSFVERDIATSPIGRMIQMTVVRHGKLMRVQLPIEKKPTRVINVTHSMKRPDYAVRLAGEWLWLGTYPYPVDITDIENVLKLLPLAIQGPDQEPEVPATIFTVIVR